MALGKEKRSALRYFWDLEISLLNDQLNMGTGRDKELIYFVVGIEMVFPLLFKYWKSVVNIAPCQYFHTNIMAKPVSTRRKIVYTHLLNDQKTELVLGPRQKSN